MSAGRTANPRSQARSSARLAAVQALYQMDMEKTPLARLLDEFHQHRLGHTIDDEEHGEAAYADAEVEFFDDIVRGVEARRAEIDAALSPRLAGGWTLARLDKTMLQVLRAGAYELIARPDVPKASVISEYVDVAKAFFDDREAKFVNGILDALAREVRG
jgi:N utilization substance protein B